MNRAVAFGHRGDDRHLARLDALAADVENLAERCGVSVRFFGSYARRQVHSRSDLDILILDDLDKSGRHEIKWGIECLASEHDIKVDIREARDYPHLATMEHSAKIESPQQLFDLLNKKLKLIQLELEHARICRDRIAKRPDPDSLVILGRDLAYSLHNIYNGIEDILKEIAKTVDEVVPSSSEHHKELLAQMTTPSSRRPAVMRNTSELWDLMSFRHMVRHAYGTSMRHQELLEKLKAVEERILPDLEAGLGETKAFLETEFGNSGSNDPSPR